MKRLVSIFLFFATATVVFPTDNYKYWVQFTNKSDSSYKIANPSAYLSAKAIQRRTKQNISIDSTDFPVNQNYIDSVLAKGVSVLTISKWFNAITISVPDTSVISTIENLPFVSKVEMTFIPNYQRKAKIDENDYPRKRVAYDNNGYGNAFAQINMHNGDWLHQAGYKGDGITIAVLDAGFLNVNTIPAFAQARNNGQILGTKDFVNANSDIYTEHYHGGQVLSVMAAYDYGTFIGTAPDASYWLIRTEDATTEFPIEVDNMVAGMEYADSVGADIITASLGYFSFDNPTMSFTYTNMDGKTCRASIAETLCIRKGMIVVNSAGNEGNSTWHYINAPADADSILTIGSVTSTLERSSFSAWGPTSDGRIKPTVCALGTSTAVINSDGVPSTNSGTSLASPIISGLTACLWQALPQLSNTEIIELIKKHGNNVDSPNNEIGYGVPDFYAAYTEGAGITKKSEFSKGDVRIYPNPTKDGLHLEIKSDIYSDNLEFILINLNGKRVFKEKIKSTNYEFSLSDLNPGVYTILIQSGEKVVYREKLIKK